MAEGFSSGRPVGTNPVLSDEHIDYLLQLVAEGDNPEEVVQGLSDKYDVTVHPSTVKYHSSRGEERVLEKRKALETQLDRIAASAKFVRLKRLERQGNRIEKTDFRTGKEGDIEDHKAKERLLIEVSEQQRKEVDGFKSAMGLEGGDPFVTLGVVSLGDLNRALKEADEPKKPANEAEKQESESPE